MEWIDFILYLHVLGATILFGTGIGIAFFMLMAHQTANPVVIAHVSRIVVYADYLFTATAAIAQPLTGLILANHFGWPLGEGWLLAAIVLYLVVGLFWLPVVFIQKRMHDHAAAASEQGIPLSGDYHRLFTIWFAFGFPAFFAMLAIFWLMLFKPDLSFVPGL